MIGASGGSTPNSSANSALPSAGGYAGRLLRKRKNRPKAALKFKTDDVDQAAINAGFDFRR
jgi:hypothetical protein